MAFDSAVTNQIALVNGPEYFVAFGGGTTHPFFGSLKLERSEILFDQQWYGNVFLLLDTFTGKVVLRYQDQSGTFTMIELDQQKVWQFTLYGHQFRKLKRLGNDKEQFFDVLFEGLQIKLVALRQKIENKSGTRVEYKTDDSYFLINNNEWITVSNQKSILNLVKDKERARSILTECKENSEEDRMVCLAKLFDKKELE
jgi:hypothetical protein